MTSLVLGVGGVHVITQLDGKEQAFLITGVLHVNKIGVNLFSIGVVTAKGMKGLFIGNKCLLYSNNKLVLTGEMLAKAMYYLNNSSHAIQDFPKSVGQVA
jgi:hypothetical protein